MATGTACIVNQYPPYLCLINQPVDCIHNDLFLFYLFTCFLCSSDLLAINPSNPKQNKNALWNSHIYHLMCTHPIPSNTHCTRMPPSTATTHRIRLVCNFLSASNASITQNASLFPPHFPQSMCFQYDNPLPQRCLTIGQLLMWTLIIFY